ncbi:putative chromosome-partitioning protein ParB [Candidatus Megaera venefica]|uniref:Probable chromosome-partitioning protein ParB n=2 Tax=Candidatus Megaera venefica TaxID=2055910 RepID=A0ABU5NCW6_9RICK|nr:putative chromosome-partitioning protein ParB [Candidatus Megaera venefica]
MRNRALGRGLSSLLNEEIIPIEIAASSNNIDLDLIEANQDQPRKYFDEEKIKELTDSIISHGLVQPIIVNKSSTGKYKIIAGERRFRACKIAGLRQIPVIIKDLTEKEILEIALIENIQRQELSAIEEAEGFQKLINEYGYSQGELAVVVGKSRSHVANLLRLNQLPESIKFMINNGQLSMGHARCLIGLENAEEIAAKILANDLNVRQVEELVSNRKRKDKTDNSYIKGKDKVVDDDLVMLGQSLSEKFGVKVVVENSWNGGRISFHYSNLEELDLILTRLN